MQPKTFELQPPASHLPGHGQLRLENWTGGTDALEVCIQRNQGAPFLSAEGEWSTTEHWLHVSGARCEGSTLLLDIGPEWVDPLLASEFKVFRVQLRGHDGRKEMLPLKIAPEVRSSAAAGSTPSAVHGGQLQASAPAPAPEPPPAPTPPEPPPPEAVMIAEEPAPAPEPAVASAQAAPRQPSRRKSWLVWAVVAAVAILAIALAAVWFLRQTGQAAATEPDVQPPPPAPVSAAECSAANMGTDDELSLVQACIRDVTDSAALLDIIQQAKAGGHCSIAQRLYANRARSDDNLIAMAYAREYDPQFHQANACFQQPEAATAVYWYQTVLDRDATNVEAKARLEALQP